MGLMDTLGRIPKILEANINAILDKCEDPAKMIDQLLIDYKRDLADVKKDTAAVMADVKLAEASAAAELDAQNISVESLTDKYAGSAGDVSVDNELAALKEKLGI